MEDRKTMLDEHCSNPTKVVKHIQKRIILVVQLKKVVPADIEPCNAVSEYDRVGFWTIQFTTAFQLIESLEDYCSV